MKKYIAAIGSLFMTTALFNVIGCDSKVANIGKDGYYFEKPSFTRTEFPVHVVLLKDETEMAVEISKRMNKVHGTVNAKDVAAFSVIRDGDPLCTIYMVDPKNKYEPEFIGHEFVHCIYGVWHSEPQN